MVSLWHKYKSAPKRQQKALQSLFAGLLYFFVLYIATYVIKGSLCPIKRIFGFSCFGCGLTRGFVSILHFDLKTAIRLNILSVPIFAGIVIHSVLCITDIIFNRKDLETISVICSRKYMFVIYLVILVISTIINHYIT